MGSIVGLLGIAWALWQEKKEEPIDQVSKRGKLLFWACIVIFTALVIAIKLYVNPLRYSLGSMFVIGISGFFLAVIVTCFLFRIKKENRQIRELSR
jgi:cbb3-type cytochrome oxidase subunit 3